MYRYRHIYVYIYIYRLASAEFAIQLQSTQAHMRVPAMPEGTADPTKWRTASGPIRSPTNRDRLVRDLVSGCDCLECEDGRSHDDERRDENGDAPLEDFEPP